MRVANAAVQGRRFRAGGRPLAPIGGSVSDLIAVAYPDREPAEAVRQKLAKLTLEQPSRTDPLDRR